MLVTSLGCVECIIVCSYDYPQGTHTYHPTSPSFTMSGIQDLIVGEAELDDDDEGDESFDEETGEIRRSTNGRNGANGVNGHLDDSSEEEDDDDEEAAQAVDLPCHLVHVCEAIY